ncbi:MAG TPA: hypothetical protein DIC36_00480 [Gammaproteobacteria bacterium]|nr:hypothetical protein [Gammaproteobacteria bacterium]
MALRGWFQDPTREPAASRSSARPQAPGARIGHDPLLIEQLRRDHRRFLDLFAHIQGLLNSADYDGVKRKLGELRITLQDHLLLASTRLYVYLSQRFATHPDRLAAISQHRSAMHSNSREIMDFLRTYSAIRLDDQSATMFQAEFLAIGTALMQRIECEETILFPLYRTLR